MNPHETTLASLRQLRELSAKLEAHLEDSSQTAKPTDERNLDLLRNKFIESAERAILDLKHPLEYWANVRGACVDTAAFRCASEMELFQRIPLTLGRTASSADLAAAVGVEAKVLTRILRLLCVHNCFQEVESNVFAHTRFSAFVQEHPHFMSFTRTSLEVFGASSTSLPDALLAPPGPKGLRPSAFEVRFGEGCYAWWNKHPDKLARFQHGLHEPLLLNEIKDSDDWDDVQGTVVDVGGGEGQVAMCLVESFPHLEFVVQDIFITPDVVDKVALGRQANRLRFEVHDYFTPQQPMEGGTFFLKHCLHNNSDVDCVRILKAIALALGQSGLGTRLIVAENVLPEWDDLSVSRQQRLELLQDDISMLQLFNAKKRTALQYQELLAQADPRLKMVGIHRPPRGQLCCLDVCMSV